MPSFTHKLQKFIASDWMIALLLLAVFLLTHGYIFPWDDQHLEVPMLKALINPHLYQGDYYVESLKNNFPSYFYRILARIITIDQIPTAYFLLYLLSRYFLFFWTYKLWHAISKSKFTGLACGLTLILIGRVEEFLYRTFSHQEFTLAIILAGFYFFYKNRFILASIIFGLAANLHAVYSLFPMLFLAGYLLIKIKEHGWKTLAGSIGASMICMVPLFILLFRKFANTHLPPGSPILENWMALYKIACPQNFVFQDISLAQMSSNLIFFIKATERFFVMAVLYILNMIFQKEFRKDVKMQWMAASTLFLVVFSFVFTYVFPSRFIIDLNLIRVVQYFLFFLVGYSTVFIVKNVEEKPLALAFLFGLFLSLMRFKGLTLTFTSLLLIFILFSFRQIQVKPKGKKNILLLGILLIASLACIKGIFWVFKISPFSHSSRLTLEITAALLLAVWIIAYFLRNSKALPVLRKLFVIIPMITITVSYVFYHWAFLQNYMNKRGFWQIQHSWIDMQRYVKKHTPVNALLLVPHDTEMGGFRIFSEREIVCSYRDCGIIGFDYAAAVEWQNRLRDIEPFKVIIDGRKPLEPVMLKALLKYKVNYIVFMRYFEPKNKVPTLKRIYANPAFALYKVLSNPVLE